MRQRGRGDSDDAHASASVAACDVLDLELGSDTIMKAPKLAPQLQRNPSARRQLFSPQSVVAGLVIAWTFLALVVDPPFVVYYVVVVATSLMLVVRAQRQARSAVGLNDRLALRSVLVLVGGLLVVGGGVLHGLAKYEIEPMNATYDFPTLTSSNSTSPSVTFYRMYNVEIDYNDDIEVIHDHFNHGSPSIERLAIDPSINAWASDVFHYEFLRHVWQSTADDDTYRVMCLAESDFVYDEHYIASLVGGSKDDPLELAHVQHFWGHRVFEPFNIALLCTSSHASLRTRLWTQVATFLHRKRYRRLLYLDLLFAVLPQRLVLYWDENHGCTDLKGHCKYIHFTQPKRAAITNAVRIIEAKKAKKIKP